MKGYFELSYNMLHFGTIFITIVFNTNGWHLLLLYNVAFRLQWLQIQNVLSRSPMIRPWKMFLESAFPIQPYRNGSRMGKGGCNKIYSFIFYRTSSNSFHSITTHNHNLVIQKGPIFKEVGRFDSNESYLLFSFSGKANKPIR